MRRDFGFEYLDQSWLQIVVVIGYAQHDDALAVEVGFELFEEFAAVRALHHKDHLCPVQLLGMQIHIGRFMQTG